MLLELFHMTLPPVHVQVKSEFHHELLGHATHEPFARGVVLVGQLAWQEP
jgi:hypothetical protein